MSEEPRMLTVYLCCADIWLRCDCPFSSRGRDGKGLYRACKLQNSELGKRIKLYIGEDGDNTNKRDYIARKELFRTCPLPKAAKKEGGE